MQKSEGIRSNWFILATVLVSILFFSSHVHAQGTYGQITGDSDAQGIVLGASVARSQKDKSAQLPVETYFGQSGLYTLEDQLSALNVVAYPEDIVTSFPDISMGMGGVIRITRATPILIHDGRKKTEVRTWLMTVGEIVKYQGLELGQDDKISPGLLTQIEPNIKIVITRVSVTNISQKEPIDFKTTKKDDPTLDKGKTKTSQAGKKGERTKTYEVRREDGVEVARKLVDNKVTKEPVEEIVLVGTKPVITVACKYNDLVLEASSKNNIDANELCTRMMRESRGNPNSDGGTYKGLFQYEEGFWNSVSAKAGYAGASIYDAKAQIFTTAWAWAHGFRGRWPK